MFVYVFSQDGTRHKKNKKKKRKPKDIERSSGDSDCHRDDVDEPDQFSGDSDSARDDLLADDEADDDMEVMEARMRHAAAGIGDQGLDTLDMKVDISFWLKAPFYSV